MRIVMFYHSLVSDWNHGNAHFLRGVASELQQRGHEVHIYEPVDSWSRERLIAAHGSAAIDAFHQAYPMLNARAYDERTIDLDHALAGADLVVVHEWNTARMIQRIGAHRAQHGHYRLLFHDTHHRCVSDLSTFARWDLFHYDGVLAFGNVIRDLYRCSASAQHVWTWHEAADVRVFSPQPKPRDQADLVWIGNWGDDERTREIEQFLIEPVRKLKLRANVYGVQYPPHALRLLRHAGIRYGGYLPNAQAPRIFAQHRVTLHIPRRYYASALPGIPTIRPFEAMACGIALICSPWHDSEGLFKQGRDYLVAHDTNQMIRHIQSVLNDPTQARSLTAHALLSIRQRHTCAHRVDQLLSICRELGMAVDTPRHREPINGSMHMHHRSAG